MIFDTIVSMGGRIQNKHASGAQSFIPRSTTSSLPNQLSVSSSHKNSRDETNTGGLAHKDDPFLVSAG